jgi:beta-lactamase regulating signal transducer with metallopeptidase domain
MDNLTRLCALSVVALHWFNPLAWWFLKLLYADLELACDEEVLAKLPSSEHKSYAHTLLSEVEKTTIFASAFGGAVIRTRIDHILSYKKMSVLAIVGSLSLLIAIAYVLLTNAA